MQMEPMELQHVVFETDEGRVDAMWSDVRLHEHDIPDGWHCYAVRGGDGGWCEPMPGYRLKVTCSDGATGIFDMSRYVDRGMFKPLKDPQTFDRVRLAFGVPSWPGDIDIAAERVRSDMQVI